MNILNELRYPEEIFVDIREQDVVIKDPYKGKPITVPEYVMLHSSTGHFSDPTGDDVVFLGLNKVFNSNAREQKNTEIQERKSFWLRNSELFAICVSVLYKWINEDERSALPDSKTRFLPNDWRKILRAKAITVDPSRNWFGFLIELNAIKNIFTNTEIFKLIDSLEKKGYSLTLLAENGFGFKVSPNIYLQLSYRKRQSTSPFDHFVNFHSLTLEKTNLRVEFGQKPEELFSRFSSDYTLDQVSSLSHKYAPGFISAVRNFNYLYELMERIKLDKNGYNALLLDLYDVNRNESSVDLDNRLKNLIAKKIRLGHTGVDHEYNWATIIKSVVLNNAEDLYTKIQNNPYEITNLFSKKRVIEKMERIYEQIFSRDNHEKEMRKYILKQIDSLREIEQHIKLY